MNGSTREEIKAARYHFLDFHHKCVTWYITVIGFFIAGLIAVDPKDQNYFIGFFIIIICSVLCLFFCQLIMHYSGRIEILGKYLNDEIPPPENWYAELKNVSPGFFGVGSEFYKLIIFTIQLAVIVLAAVKYIL